MSNVTFIVATSLELAMDVNADVTVEAEYGATVVEGNLFTAAHHQKEGPFNPAASPAPCNNPSIPVIKMGTVLLSHLDLDSIGGALRVLESDVFAGNESFWQLAEFVDLHGVHRLGQSDAGPINTRALYAVWAWLQDHRPRPDFKEVQVVTEFISDAAEAISAILDGDEDKLAAGDKFREAEDKLNVESFMHSGFGVVVRTAPGFTNHLYVGADGSVGEAVVAYNTKFGSITVSFADGGEKASAREIVQELWGKEAGGRDGIAGSPRGTRMTSEDLTDAFNAVAVALM